MPLLKECTVSAMEANISTEMRAGKERILAVAIAQQTLRDACKEAGKPVPTRKALEVIANQPTVGIVGVEGDAELLREHDITAGPDPLFEGDVVSIQVDDDTKVLVAKRKHQKRERTKEFLEGAFERARAILNPRDFAIIFQAARASAGGQISARRRRERQQVTPEALQLIEKASLKEMSVDELRAMSETLNSAHSRNKKMGSSTKRVLSRAASMLEEFARRGLDAPEGLVYVDLKKRGVDSVRKGFLSGSPDGGMHAHGLDRRNGKTLDDGGHVHIWIIPGTGEIIVSREDGLHQHVVGSDGNATKIDGAHSHMVLLANGAMIETRLDGPHDHELMLETSGFDGLHGHVLVMPDGSELKSMTPGQFARQEGHLPASEPLVFASMISGAMRELREEREHAMVGAPLPELAEAVELTAKGATIAPPTFTVEVLDAADYPGFDCGVGDMMEVRYDDEIVGFSKHVVPSDPDETAKAVERWSLIEKHTSQVPFTGSQDARLMFVSAAPNALELARRQAIVGDDAITFNDVYLKPLGLAKGDVAVGFAMPVLPHEEMNAALCEKWSHKLVEAMKTYHRAKVVALGKVARDVLKSAGVEFWSLPHPSAVRRQGDSGEVSRKLRAIAKALDLSSVKVSKFKSQHKRTPSNGAAPANLTDAISEMRKTGHAVCRVVKTADEKQIVYGVVLDPYDVDLQTEWVPPAEIESTAHGFLKKSRVIGFEHVERAEAQIVESWVEVYPSTADYEAAKDNRPHRAFTRKFGDDVIHSGAWVAGVQLGDKEWALHKEGQLNAFSVGGFSFKTRITTAAMPEVEFIELVESA